MVYGEIVRAIDHARLPLDVHLWRDKDGEAVDFLVSRQAGGTVLALDAKLAIQGVRATSPPRHLARVFPQLTTMHLVTLGAERRALSPSSVQVPVADLFGLLREFAAG